MPALSTVRVDERTAHAAVERSAPVPLRSMRVLVERTGDGENHQRSPALSAARVSRVAMAILPEPCVKCGHIFGRLRHIERQSLIEVLHFVCSACLTPALDVQPTTAHSSSAESRSDVAGCDDK